MQRKLVSTVYAKKGTVEQRHAQDPAELFNEGIPHSKEEVHQGNVPTSEWIKTEQSCLGNNINLQNPRNHTSTHRDSFAHRESIKEARAAEVRSKGEVGGMRGDHEEITSETINKFLDGFFGADRPSDHFNRHLKTGDTPEEHVINLPANLLTSASFSCVGGG